MLQSVIGSLGLLLGVMFIASGSGYAFNNMMVPQSHLIWQLCIGIVLIILTGIYLFIFQLNENKFVKDKS